MSVSALTPSGAASYCLVVEAEPDTNALLRVLEPFVIHDVVPARVDAARHGAEDEAVLRLDILFDAEEPLAARLAARLATMVTVRTCRLSRLRAAAGTLDTAA